MDVITMPMDSANTKINVEIQCELIKSIVLYNSEDQIDEEVTTIEDETSIDDENEDNEYDPFESDTESESTEETQATVTWVLFNLK